MREKILIVSLLLNLILIGCLLYLFNRKGGIRFIKRKIGIDQIHTDYGYGPYYNQRKSLFDLLPRDTNDILFIGHSLVDGCEWAELFNNPHIKNRGINGEQIEGILKRMNTIINPPPSKIFLMTGANDLGGNQSAENLLSNYKKIIDTLKQHCPVTKVYLISILPSGFESYEMNNRTITEFNTGLRKMANESHYTYIDLYSEVKDENNYFDSELTNDGWHLMGAGYIRLKEILTKYLN